VSSRLLLVDDEYVIGTIGSISLERIGGWTLIAAASGQAALEAVQDDGPFDAVLMDVMMPGIDGPSTLGLMRDGVLPAELQRILAH
jgi:two-component system OmpR family response regulator